LVASTETSFSYLYRRNHLRGAFPGISRCRLNHAKPRVRNRPRDHNKTNHPTKASQPTCHTHANNQPKSTHSATLGEAKRLLGSQIVGNKPFPDSSYLTPPTTPPSTTNSRQSSQPRVSYRGFCAADRAVSARYLAENGPATRSGAVGASEPAAQTVHPVQGSGTQVGARDERAELTEEATNSAVAMSGERRPAAERCKTAEAANPVGLAASAFRT